VKQLRVLVPMRPLTRCKRRLAAVLPDAAREALVLMMLSRTVRTIVDEVGRAGCLVIGGDAWVKQVVLEAGATWIDDVATDLNATVTAVMRQAYRDGASAAMFVPVDVPMITGRDIRAVVEASADWSRPAAVEAEADGGTNALLIPADIPLLPELGQHSYQRHRLQAERLGTPLAGAIAPGLAFDLDRPSDLALARVRIPGFSSELSTWERRMGAVDPLARAAGRL
jgi:2-phospho-L-lactate guanylyltransferase